LDTPIGRLFAVGDEQAVHLVEFAEQRQPIKKALAVINAQARMQYGASTSFVEGKCALLSQLEAELRAYFAGSLRGPFRTPFRTYGTAIRRNSWQVISEIPYGTTISHHELVCFSEHLLS
jgi:AraC family transcriptional regulator of adaptative response/methylated-DNA-[protein]-cysteine methyltransferase